MGTNLSSDSYDFLKFLSEGSITRKDRNFLWDSAESIRGECNYKRKEDAICYLHNKKQRKEGNEGFIKTSIILRHDKMIQKHIKKVM